MADDKSLVLAEQLELIQSYDPAPILNRDDEGVYRVSGIDELIGNVERAIESTNDAKFTDEDRKQIKAARAFVNKLDEFVNRAVIDEKNRVFNTADSDRKRLREATTRLSTTLKERLDDFDARERARKRDELSAAFDDAKFMYDDDDVSGAIDLGSLTFAEIEDSRWSNRSASRNKAIQELNERITSVVSLGAIDPELDNSAALEILEDAEWSTASAVILVNENKARREREEREAREREEARKRELEEAERRGREQAQREAAERAEREAREQAERRAANAKPRDEGEGFITLRVGFNIDSDEAIDDVISRITKTVEGVAGVTSVRAH